MEETRKATWCLILLIQHPEKDKSIGIETGRRLPGAGVVGRRNFKGQHKGIWGRWNCSGSMVVVVTQWYILVKTQTAHQNRT